MITFLGAFPPPVTGASKNNQILLDDLQAAGALVRKLDVSADRTSHSRNFFYHLQRLVANTIATLKLLWHGGNTLYTVPDGGWGLAYNSVQIAVARLRFNRVIFHHRVYSYIIARSWIMALIVMLTRSRSTHVFLCQEMARDFQSVYGRVNFSIVSNAHYVIRQSEEYLSTPRAVRPTQPLKIGHLSNLCQEKGFFVVADTFDAVIASGVNAELQLAGPLIGESVKERLERLKEKHGTKIQYHGPLHGEAKDNFYQGLHLFIFPTQYPLESWGNVLYESFAAGTPVLTIRRGCIRGFVSELRGAACKVDDNFVEFAIKFISAFDFSSDEFRGRSRKIAKSVLEEGMQAKDDYISLIKHIIQPKQHKIK